MNDMEKNAEIENLRNRLATQNSGILDLKYELAKAQLATMKWKTFAVVSSVSFVVLVAVRGC